MSVGKQDKEDEQAGRQCSYKFRRIFKICFSHSLSDAFPSCCGCRDETRVTDMRAAALSVLVSFGHFQQRTQRDPSWEHVNIDINIDTYQDNSA